MARLVVAAMMVAGCAHPLRTPAPLVGPPAGKGPSGAIVYMRGSFPFAGGTTAGSGGVFLRRIGGRERRLLGGDGSLFVQPTYVDARGHIIYSRGFDDVLCARCTVQHPDGWYWIDPAEGTEHAIALGYNQRLVGGRRFVYQAGGKAGPTADLRSRSSDGGDEAVIASPGWMCGVTHDDRVLFLRPDLRELVIANADGGDPHVIAEEVDWPCDVSRPTMPIVTGLLPDGRVVFRGRPAGGGDPGEYVATLDGAARSITSERVEVLAATPDDRFAVVSERADGLGGFERDRIEVLAPGAAPIASLSVATYNQLTDVTPSGRVIVGRYDGYTDPVSEDYESIGADGRIVPIATAARYLGAVGGRVVFDQRAIPGREHPTAGVWSVPEDGGAPTPLAAGAAVAVVDGWVVYQVESPRADSDAPMPSVLGAVAPDGTRGHDLHRGRDAFEVDVIGDGWIAYRDGDTLGVARVDGSEDDRVADDAVFALFVPDR